MRNFIRLSAAIAAGTMLAAGSAYAANTDTMTVSGQVTAVCDVTATNLGFTATPSNIATDWTVGSASALSITCTNGSTFSVGIDSGANQSGAGADRRMKNGTTDFLAYKLYSENTFNTEVAADTSTTNYSVSETGTGAAVDYFLGAKVTQANVNAAKALTYTDTITVTVTLL